MELRRLFLYENESYNSKESILRNTYLFLTSLVFLPIIFTSKLDTLVVGAIWLGPVTFFWTPIIAENARFQNSLDYLLYFLIWIPFVGLGIMTYLYYRNRNEAPPKNQVEKSKTEKEVDPKSEKDNEEETSESKKITKQTIESLSDMIRVNLNGEEQLHKCELSPKGQYAICYKQGHVDATGDERRQTPGSLGVLTVNSEGLDDVVYETDKLQPSEAAVNDKGEWVVVETDTDERDLVQFFEKDQMVWKEEFDENIMNVGLSNDSLAILVTAPAWSTIYAFDPEGKKWVKDLPSDVPSKAMEVEFGEKFLNFSEQYGENKYSLTYSGEIVDNSIEKGFYGKLNELYEANENKEWNKAIEIYEEEIEDHENFNQVSQEAVYAAVAEAYYRLDKPLESIKFWKEAEKEGELSNSRIKSMRKPYREILRNKEDYNKDTIRNRWINFLEKYDEFTSSRDEEMLEEIGLQNREKEAEPVNKKNLDSKTGIFKSLDADKILLKRGGLNYDPQKIEIWNKELETIEEKKFNFTLKEAIILDNGIVVHGKTKKEDSEDQHLVYLDEELNRKNEFTVEDSWIRIYSELKDSILMGDGNSDELYLFSDDHTQKLTDDIIRVVEEVVEEENLELVDRNTQGDGMISFSSPPVERQIRDMTMFNSKLIVNVSQHILSFEIENQSLELIDTMDTRDILEQNKEFYGRENDPTWVTYLGWTENKLIAGKYKGDIFEIKKEDLSEVKYIGTADCLIKEEFRNTEIKNFQNQIVVSSMTEDKKKGKITVINSNNQIKYEKDTQVGPKSSAEIQTNNNHFLAMPRNNQIKVLDENFKEKLTKKFSSKTRTALLSGKLFTSEESIEVFDI